MDQACSPAGQPSSAPRAPGGCRRPGPRAPQRFCTIVLVLPREEGQTAQEAAAEPGPCIKGRTALVGARGHCLHSWGSGSPRVTQPLPPLSLQEDAAQLAGPELPTPERGVGLLQPPGPGHVRCQRRLPSQKDRWVPDAAGVGTNRERGEGPPHPGSSG